MKRGLHLLWLLLALARPAFAHKPSDSYLTLIPDGASVRVRWDIALRDLDYALALDANADGALTGREFRDRSAEVSAYALERLALSADERACAFCAAEPRLTHHSDGAYLALLFEAACPRTPGALAVSYRLFSELDPQHRGLVRLEAGGETRTGVLRAEANTLRFTAGVLAALNNLRPLLLGRWRLAFGLGLLHGFGFSSVLADLGLSGASVVMNLLAFNLGVELGQAAVVAVFLPTAFLLRRTWAYRSLAFVGGSACIALTAGVWTVQRFLL